MTAVICTIDMQVTQLSEVGWLLGASGSHGDVTYATFVSPDRKDFTVAVVIGLGRIVALYCRSSTLYQIH